MTLFYKDRAKQLLKGAAYDNTLSPPPTGFVPLPTDGYFEGVIVCADGSWQTGVFSVLDQGGGVFALSYGETYANSSGTTSNIMSSRDFSLNNAEVFCTISAKTINELSSVLEWSGGGQNLTGETSVSSSSSRSALYEPVWPGHPACPVGYMEYEFRVYAAMVYGAPPYAKTWVGTATFSDGETPVVAYQNVIGAANTELEMTPSIDMNSGWPMLKLSYTNNNADLSCTFRAEVIVRRIAHESACW